MKIMVIGSATSATSSPAIAFRAAARRWHGQLARLFDLYQPERHYMRGPGPKCFEKHDLSEHAL
jgi:hypothetical protein